MGLRVSDLSARSYRSHLSFFQDGGVHVPSRPAPHRDIMILLVSGLQLPHPIQQPLAARGS